MTRHATTAAALAAVLAGFVVLAGLLMPAPAAEAAQAPPAAAVQVQTPVTAEDAFLAALLGPGTGIPANADALLIAADLVCEGITAEVPVMVMADGTAADLSLTDEEARHFVNTAAVTWCQRDDSL